MDVTEIYSQLTWEKHLRLYKLCYLIILLVLCIFWYCGSRCFDTLHEALFGLCEVTFKYVIGYFGLLEEISIDQASVLPTSLLTVSIFRLLFYLPVFEHYNEDVLFYVIFKIFLSNSMQKPVHSLDRLIKE